mmetsp:Transcript_17858/g.37126  ORF Transcript_17858/g.37126 Transcript_17858/m.37126 type:complete len:80 (+) Transcript_17858:310-549(+)
MEDINLSVSCRSTRGEILSPDVTREVRKRRRITSNSIIMDFGTLKGENLRYKIASGGLKRIDGGGVTKKGPISEGENGY